MCSAVYKEQAVARVMELLQPDAKAELERFRITGGVNRIYKIPLSPDSDAFVVVKLPAGLSMELGRQWGVYTRNIAYGEYFVEYLGKKRALAEISLHQEWQAEGLPVPELIECPLPYVRIFEGVPHPSYRDILDDGELSVEHKLHLVRCGMDVLSHHHGLALERGNPRLVHPESNPKNMLFDWETQKTHWIDLEHPWGMYSRSVEFLAVRGLRLFIVGVLYKLPDQLDAVLDRALECYEPKHVLWALAENLERGLNRPPLRLAHLLGRAKRQVRFRRQLASGLQRRLSGKVVAK